MKTLKFTPPLVKMILDGNKTTTWRLFDDKDSQPGDKLNLQNCETGEDFAKAEILEIQEKELGELENTDFDGHEKFLDQEDVLEQYREYYGEKVNLNTVVKVIKFKLVK